MENNVLFQKFVSFTAAVHQVTHEMTKDVRSESLTPVQYKILEYISVSQPVTLSEISDCMHMSMPNTSRELRKLSEKQLCEKITDTEDRRKQSIRLSKEGSAMMGDIFQQVESQFVQKIGNVTEADLKEIEHALDVLMRRVFY
ncbi:MULTISPECIES: MarR family winged helix-turn-helix transcriptional regulator [Paenibacillus]|uniref:MarR family transcriptional regulator n=1 Tax=Paenibacillus violae TaxID=3077234 RepID=A0ABU3R9U3_9BACL|nr:MULTISPECIES: MarR family transcriptional regulator [Paenibacillus]MDU0201043.1 MarR family transcriptional regulator [Paenibacillus sp. PFR10]MEC0264902.1 MarR family transcriptional regulator [Paenibacillus anseongense]